MGPRFPRVQQGSHGAHGSPWGPAAATAMDAAAAAVSIGRSASCFAKPCLEVDARHLGLINPRNDIGTLLVRIRAVILCLGLLSRS